MLMKFRKNSHNECEFIRAFVDRRWKKVRLIFKWISFPYISFGNAKMHFILVMLILILHTFHFNSSTRYLCSTIYKIPFTTSHLHTDTDISISHVMSFLLQCKYFSLLELGLLGHPSIVLQYETTVLPCQIADGGRNEWKWMKFIKIQKK